MGRLSTPEVTASTFVVKANPIVVRAWAERRRIPGWLRAEPSGWTVLSVLAGHTLVGLTELSIPEALVELDQLGTALLLGDQDMWGVEAGRPVKLPDDFEVMEWEQDDLNARGIIAARGNWIPVLKLIAAGTGEQLDVLRDGGWTLLDAKAASSVAAVMSDGETEGGAVLGLQVNGEEVRLSAHLDTGRVDWSWNQREEVVAGDCIPDTADGEELRQFLFGTPDVNEELAEAWPDHQVSVPAVADVVATRGASADVVPRLAAAVGVPAAVTDHLLGLVPLTGHPGAERITPEKSRVAAVARYVASEISGGGEKGAWAWIQYMIASLILISLGVALVVSGDSGWQVLVLTLVAGAAFLWRGLVLLGRLAEATLLVSNVIELLMASLQYRVRAPAGQVRAWAHHRGVR